MLIFWMSVGCEGMDGGGAWGKGTCDGLVAWGYAYAEIRF